MDVYFAKNDGSRFRFPVTPGSIAVATRNRNRTAALIDGSEINIANPPGLRDISFDALLPNKHYYFAVYEDGVFMPAAYFTELIAEYKEDKNGFWLVLGGAEQSLFTGQSMKVALEDYTVSEDSDYGGDVVVSLRLRELKETGITEIDPGRSVVQTVRGTSSAPPVPKTYTVQKGDTLWGIAKRLLGSGSRYTEIYELNRGAVSNPNLIYAGQELVLP